MATFEKPMLASENWSADSEHDLEEADGDGKSTQHKLRTGSKAIDELFDGGLNYGVVHCITSKADDGARDLSLAILAFHLLQSPGATATVIDSTLSFDVRRLHHVLQVSVQSSSRGTSDAMEALNRLNISKVFDALGLSEALAELRAVLGNGERESGGDHAAQHEPRATIEDSEDEEDLELSAMNSPPERLLIIDSVSHIMTPIIRNDFGQGQAKLTSFMVALADITRRYNLCTIVLGDAGFKQVEEDETLSMFKSCRIKPAVGVGISYLVDVHMYLHKPFKPKELAPQAGEVQTQLKQVVSVLEIVEDRRSARYQSYAPFAFTPDGLLQDVL